LAWLLVPGCWLLVPGYWLLAIDLTGQAVRTNDVRVARQPSVTGAGGPATPMAPLISRTATNAARQWSALKKPDDD